MFVNITLWNYCVIFIHYIVLPRIVYQINLIYKLSRLKRLPMVELSSISIECLYIIIYVLYYSEEQVKIVFHFIYTLQLCYNQGLI